jgi:hypothetical protein
MKKPISIEKAFRIETLLRKRMPYLDIHDTLKTEFGSSVSNNTLQEVKYRLNSTQYSLTSEIKESISIVIELFKKSLDIDEFNQSISEKEEDAINLLEGLI